MEREERSDRFTAVEDRYAGYTVYDKDYDKIGRSMTCSWTRQTSRNTSA